MQLARERAARQVAEKAMRRSQLLSEASRLHVRSLDFDDTLASVHRAVVPALADACQPVLCDANGDCWFAPPRLCEVRRGASTTGSHGRIQTVDSRLAHAVGDTIETGHAAVVPGEIVQHAPAVSRWRVLPEALIAPLIARDIPLGAIICCRRGTRRRFGTADVVLIEDLADRAATALDNAQLFQTIREGERKKDEFLAMLGHELRNPLAAISNAGELTRLLDTSDTNFGELLEIIRQQTSLMRRLVDDLLDVSRITSGRVKLQKAKVCAERIMVQVAESIGPQITARNHVLHLSVPAERIVFDADPCRLAQILSNLLLNASKYTEPGGDIWFSAEREQNEIVFRVKDSGIGIGPELLPHVFDLFSQAGRSLHRADEGLGIGLNIVRGLTELHGGRVRAASAGIGRGSEFNVYLPAEFTRQTEVPRAPTLSPSEIMRQRRVLVVEDQPALLHVTVALLKRLGHEVYAAADGHEAIQAIKVRQPEVVLLDIGLPGMDGYEVAQSVRAELGDLAPHLVAMTGYGPHELVRYSDKVRFDRHLVKPVDMSALQELFAQFE
jgi:signal transduction histidine kinase